jgi:hypothetical protein
VSPTGTTVTAPVTLTATAPGISAPQYEFWVQTGTVWQIIKSKSAASTCIWGPAVKGYYAFRVIVSDGTTAQIQGMAVSPGMTVNPILPSGITLVVSPKSPQQLTPATITATATCAKPLEYAFAVSTTTGQQTTWQIIQPFSTKSVCTWTPVTAGTNTVEVLIRIPSIPDGPLATKTLACTVTANSTPPVTTLNVAPYSGDRSGAISYSFDDGYQCEANVIAPIFSEFGLHATFYIVMSWTPETTTVQDPAEQADWNTWANVQAAGHEVGSHTVNHVDLTTVNSTTLQTEVNSSADIIKQHLGSAPLTLAYPYNAWNATVAKVVQQRYIWDRETFISLETENFTLGFANKIVDNAILSLTAGRWEAYHNPLISNCIYEFLISHRIINHKYYVS